MDKTYLPHFYRRIAAPFLFVSIQMFILVNLFHTFFFGFTDEKKIKLHIMSYPKVSAFHEQLGQLYLKTNKQRAETEYRLAGEFYQILGMETGLSAVTNDQNTYSEPRMTWNSIVNQDVQIREELAYWKNISMTMPDYYYAKLKMAVLYSQLGKTEESASILENLKKNPALDLKIAF